MRRAFVSLPDGVWEIIDRDIRGGLGEGDSEIIRNIVISYLSDKGYFINERHEDTITELRDKVTIMEEMVTTMVNTFEEMGVLNVQEFENKVRKQISKSAHKDESKTDTTGR